MEQKDSEASLPAQWGTGLTSRSTMCCPKSNHTRVKAKLYRSLGTVGYQKVVSLRELSLLGHGKYGFRLLFLGPKRASGQ